MSSFLIFFYWLCLAVFVTLHSGDAARTSQKIYIPIAGVRGCFRRLNATHQTGCSSSMSGNIGVVHYMETEEDFSYIINKAPYAPYIALMDSVNFNRRNIERLRDSGHVSGILVIHTINNETLTPTPESFSPELACPNDRYGLYTGHAAYAHCKQVLWNEEGNGLLYEDFHIPIFVMFNETEVKTIIEKCYRKFNQANGSAEPTELGYPFCAAELKSAMYAVQSSITCRRRTNHMTNLMPDKVCDPLGDKNVYATVKATASDEELSPNSIIVAASKLDSVSLFAKVDPAADSPITDIVVLLVAVHALKLSGAMDRIRNQSDAKDIMFTLLQGESFDYIGSSRMVYDMQKGEFPVKPTNDDKLIPHPINMTHLSYFIELNQLGFRDDAHLWIHTDPITRQMPPILKQIKHMVQEISHIADEVHLSIRETEGNQALPPASVQRFIMEQEIPAIVLTDHEKIYTNKYYNSRFDLPYLINGSYPDGLNSTEWYNYTTPLASNLTDIATVIARTLYSLSTGDNNTDFIEADSTQATHMLYCLLYNASCELFQIIVEPADAAKLPESPFPLYVSVNTDTSPVTSVMRRLLTYYMGDHMTNITTKEACVQPDKNKVYTYSWMQGPRKTLDKWDRVPMCYRSTAGLTKAESPAFEEDNYDMFSGKYSTWTESVWDEFSVRIFLIPNPQLQATTLGLGIALFLVSLISVYFFNKKASVVFSSHTY